jgi:two-component system cell cycle response regulator DivK
MDKKILIIEDNEQNLYLITFILEKHRYQVIQARDGQTGINLAIKEKPDLILLDIQLPIMDGYKVAEELRRSFGNVDVPIIAITSYAMVGDKEKALAAGCTGYLTKPIDPDTFVSYIERFLKSNE